MTKTIAEIDQDAVQMGSLYESGGKSFIDAVVARLHCGELLISKKSEVGRGAWQQWLKDNRATLGFGDRAARQMMSAAKRQSTTVLKTEDEARQISKGMWGNNKPKKAKAPRKKPTTTVEYFDDEEESNEEPNDTPQGELPEHMRVRGFLYRADESARGAEADDLTGVNITKEMIDAAKRAADAWTKLHKRLLAANG